MATLKDFIAEHGITAFVRGAETNPNMLDKWDANHYKVTLRNRAGRRLTVPFSMGRARSDEPDAALVLDTLASDSASVDSADDFEEWCSELGFDTDSRNAERSYKVTLRQAEKLQNFLGPDAYTALLYQTDRI